MSNYVFVYGTLQQGCGNHAHYLSHSKYLGKAVTVAGNLLLTNSTGGGFPYALYNKTCSWGDIIGEVYEVDNTTLLSIDRLEQHPSWYRRHRVQVELLDTPSQSIMATMYVIDITLEELAREHAQCEFSFSTPNSYVDVNKNAQQSWSPVHSRAQTSPPFSTVH